MDGTLVADESVELKRSLKLLNSKSCSQIAFRPQVGKKPYIKDHTRDADDRKKDNGIETTLQRPISGLLRLPVELRLEIYRRVFCEALRICPHSNLPMVILARKLISRKTCGYWNPILRCQLLPSLVPAYLDTPLPVLGINRQIDAEVGESYVVFLEKCFTHFDDRPCRPSNDPYKVKEILKDYDPDLWQCVRRLGFSINQLPDVFTRNRDDEIVRFQNGLSWIDRHMPHLEYLYIALFIKREHHSRMSFARFLAALIVSLKAMKGQKVITLYGTNKAKVAVPNQWKNHSQGEPILIIGGCQCATWYSIASTYPSRQYYPSGVTGVLIDGMDYWIRQKEKLAVEGSRVKQRNHQSKGPLVGCLLSRTKTTCEHDPKYNPKRLTPTLSRSGELLKP